MDTSPLSVGLDWVAFTYFPGGDDWRDELRGVLRDHFGVEEWEPRRGWQGYEVSARAGGVLIAWGGAGQRGSVHVEVPGAVCGACGDWPVFVEWLQRVGARLTRVDIAGDDYFGAQITVDWALAEYSAGGFTVARATRPAGRLVDDLGSGAGRTLYVGKRENGKLARVYEKGRQLGDRLSKWTRYEVEWRAKDRILEMGMLLRPAAFLAGAYPCAALFSNVLESVRTFKARAVLTYQKMVAVARQHAGRAINAMLLVTHGDMGQVVSLLRRGGLPSRLSPREIGALAGAWS